MESGRFFAMLAFHCMPSVLLGDPPCAEDDVDCSTSDNDTRFPLRHRLRVARRTRVFLLSSALALSGPRPMIPSGTCGKLLAAVRYVISVTIGTRDVWQRQIVWLFLKNLVACIDEPTPRWHQFSRQLCRPSWSGRILPTLAFFRLSQVLIVRSRTEIFKYVTQTHNSSNGHDGAA